MALISVWAGLFVGGCGLAVLFCVTSSRGVRRAIGTLLVCALAAAALMFLHAGPRRFPAAWRHGVPALAPDIQIVRGPAGRRRILVNPPYGPSVSVVEAQATSHGNDREEIQTAPVYVPSERIKERGLLWSLATATAIAALLFVGYLFLNAATLGHFTWPLRILSLLAFAALYAAVTVLRHKS